VKCDCALELSSLINFGKLIISSIFNERVMNEESTSTFGLKGVFLDATLSDNLCVSCASNREIKFYFICKKLVMPIASEYCSNE